MRFRALTTVCLAVLFSALSGCELGRTRLFSEEFMNDLGEQSYAVAGVDQLVPRCPPQ